MLDITNKNIIITGSGRGIGLDLATAISHLGAKVIRIDKKFLKGSRKFDDFKFDLKNLKKISSLFSKIRKKYKKIDGLVNNAGVTFHNNFSLKSTQKTLNINLLSHFELIKAVCPIMAKNKKGSIINITSLGSDLGFPSNPSYQMSKAGLKQLSKSVAIDWGNKGIRCNSIKPGYIETSMTKKSKSNSKEYKKRLDRMILKRWGRPSDLVGAIVFLLSDHSSYITGTEIIIDGGWSIKGL
jgi:NAD(P)-dependent dehydrogenase (short-subunit alcohol dehydrogenase family)